MLRRIFFGLARLAFIGLLIVAAWLGWYIFAHQPLQTVRLNWTGDLPTGGTPSSITSWSAPVLGQERVVMIGSNGILASIFEVDLKAGRGTEIVNNIRLKGSCTAPRLSWVAWTLDDIVHVALLPGGQVRFTIPGLPAAKDSNGRCSITASQDDRLLAIAASDGKYAEIWDVPARTRRLRLEEIAGPVAFSANGSHIAAFTDSNHVGVWEVANGEKVATLPASGVAPGQLGFAPDGRLLIGWTKTLIAEPSGPGITMLSGPLPKVPLDLTLWSSDFRRVEAKFQSETSLTHAYVFAPHTFSSDGRIVILFRFGTGKNVWDISAQPPRCIDAEIAGNSGSAFVEIDVRCRRLASYDGTEIRLYDWPTLQPLPVEDAQSGVAGQFSPSGRWLIGFEKPTTKNPPWEQWLRRNLPQSWLGGLDPTSNLIIWETDTGRIRNRIPGQNFVAWPFDESAVWVQMSRSNSAAPGEKVFALWPTMAPRPPWWLYLLTVIGVVAIIADIRRMLRRRIQPEASNRPVISP